MKKTTIGWERMHWACDDVLDVSMGSKCVLMMLMRHINSSPPYLCNPSQPLLAKKCCTSERSIGRYLVELEEKGYIQRDMNHRKSTKYSVSDELITQWTGEGSQIVHPDNIEGSQIVHPDNEGSQVVYSEASNCPPRVDKLSTQGSQGGRPKGIKRSLEKKKENTEKSKTASPASLRSHEDIPSESSLDEILKPSTPKRESIKVDEQTLGQDLHQFLNKHSALTSDIVVDMDEEDMDDEMVKAIDYWRFCNSKRMLKERAKCWKIIKEFNGYAGLDGQYDEEMAELKAERGREKHK